MVRSRLVEKPGSRRTQQDRFPSFARADHSFQIKTQVIEYDSSKLSGTEASGHLYRPLARYRLANRNHESSSMSKTDLLSASVGDGPKWALLAGGAIFTALSAVMGRKRNRNVSDTEHGFSGRSQNLTSNAEGDLTGDADFGVFRTNMLQDVMETNSQVLLDRHSQISPLFNNWDEIGTYTASPSGGLKVSIGNASGIWSNSYPDQTGSAITKTLPARHLQSDPNEADLATQFNNSQGKRDTVARMKHELKKKDAMLHKLRAQVSDQDQMISMHVSHSRSLEAELETAKTSLFESEREIQRLRKAIADHCAKYNCVESSSANDQSYLGSSEDNSASVEITKQEEVQQYDGVGASITAASKVLNDLKLNNEKQRSGEISKANKQIQNDPKCENARFSDIQAAVLELEYVKLSKRNEDATCEKAEKEALCRSKSEGAAPLIQQKQNLTAVEASSKLGSGQKVEKISSFSSELSFVTLLRDVTATSELLASRVGSIEPDLGSKGFQSNTESGIHYSSSSWNKVSSRTGSFLDSFNCNERGWSLEEEVAQLTIEGRQSISNSDEYSLCTPAKMKGSINGPIASESPNVVFGSPSVMTRSITTDLDDGCISDSDQSYEADNDGVSDDDAYSALNWLSQVPPFSERTDGNDSEMSFCRGFAA